MRRIALTLTAALALVLAAGPSFAFCGFYVAKADTQLFNKASKVVIVRDGDRTVLTMANDYRGDPKEFADAVTLLIDDRCLLATIQATNKREAEELYEVSRYSARMERVYDSIVHGQIGTLGSDSHPALR